jgi:hypothetical protein
MKILGLEISRAQPVEKNLSSPDSRGSWWSANRIKGPGSATRN